MATTARDIKLKKLEMTQRREDRLWALLANPAIMEPLLAVGGAVALHKAGKARIIQRDLAGFLFSAWNTYWIAKAGVSSTWGLGAFWAASTAAYSLTVPPTDEEALVTINPGKLLGGDGKLFWWDVPFIPNTW